MDKVKTALALLKKHHFWVMTCMVMLLSFIGWFVASSKLWGEYQTSKAKIEKKFGDLQKINGEERENQKWVDGLAAETLQLKKKVGIAWDKVYTEQKDHVLKWPVILGAKNVATLEALGPNDPIPVRVREEYLNYIQSEFPRLLEIVDARDYRADKQGTGDKKAAAQAAEAQDYKVIWDSKNQEGINNRLNWRSTPNSQEVRDAQEDLWVYQALLTIINQLNDRATGNYNAKIKEIQSLLIGGDAVADFQAGASEGRIDKLDATGTMTTGSTPTGSTGAIGSFSSVGRYVDEKGMPLGGAAPAGDAAAGDVAAAPTGGAAPAEFKRMPVVMRLVMDQREVSRLLVECANSPLPVEVRQFRLHSRKGIARTSQQPNNAAAGLAEKDQSSYDVNVEVGGIIYIFNPPDHAKLGDLAVAEPSGAQPGAETVPANANGGKPDAAAMPPADGAGSAPVNGGSEPVAAPARAAGPGDAENTEGNPEKPPESK